MKKKCAILKKSFTKICRYQKKVVSLHQKYKLKSIFKMKKLFFLLLMICMCSCTSSRLITTSQTHIKNGDTITVMSTKMLEEYQATKTNF